MEPGSLVVIVVVALVAHGLWKGVGSVLRDRAASVAPPSSAEIMKCTGQRRYDGVPCGSDAYRCRHCGATGCQQKGQVCTAQIHTDFSARCDACGTFPTSFSRVQT